MADSIKLCSSFSAVSGFLKIVLEGLFLDCCLIMHTHNILFVCLHRTISDFRLCGEIWMLRLIILEGLLVKIRSKVFPWLCVDVLEVEALVFKK